MKLVEASKVRKKYKGGWEQKLAVAIDEAAKKQESSIFIAGLDPKTETKLRKLGYTVSQYDFTRSLVSW